MKKRKHTGWIFLLVLAILITHMPTAKMGEDNDTELIDLNGVPFETILSGNAKKDNKERRRVYMATIDCMMMDWLSIIQKTIMCMIQKKMQYGCRKEKIIR